MKTLAALLLAAALLAAPAHAITFTTPGTYDGHGTTVTGLEAKGDGITVRNYNLAGGEVYAFGSNIRLENLTGTATRLVVNKWNLPMGAGTHDVGIYNCTLQLGQGVTTGEHIMLWWNVDRPSIVNCKITITCEAGLPAGQSGAGGWWNFTCRNGTYRGDTVRVIEKRADYAAIRWRGDKGLVDGCHDNRFDRCAFTVEGSPGRILWSSSADPGTQPGDGNLVGHWNVTIDSCLVSSTGDELYWQGGMKGWQITDSKLIGKVAVHAFDIHNVRLQRCTIQSNQVGGKAERWTTEYPRPLPEPGALVDCNNLVVGAVEVAPDIAAHPEWRVTTCGPPPVQPPPTAPADTVRVVIDGAGLPVKVTVR